MLQIEPASLEIAGERIFFIFVLPRVQQPRKPVEHFRVERQRLADFARRRTSAIGDHIGRHRRAQFAVSLIDILNRALALISAWQIQINIRPLAALLGKKSLEKQIHAHRIHGGNAQRIADRAVGRRPASLHQNIFLAAEADNVPNDQEIAGEIELLDQLRVRGQFACRARALSAP